MRRSAFLTLAALAGCGRPRPEAQSNPGGTQAPVRIIALGDSLAFGTGASSPQYAFIFRAFERVRARRPASEVDNIAMGGSTVADVLRLQAPRLISTRFDIVVICVGGNDVIRRVAPASFGATYVQLLAAVRRAQPHSRIVCCGVPNVGISPLFAGIDHTAIAGLAQDDDAAVRAAARAPGVGFVDLFAVTSAARGVATRFLSDDRFHPSDEGYAKLADILAPALLRAADAGPYVRP